MLKQKLMLIDDEVDNLDALERLFRKKYEILRATSGQEALTVLSKNAEIDVIITDQRMPAMTGVEFLHESLKTHPNSVRILMTGYTDIDSIIAAVNDGHIFRYITKPWDSLDLLNSVEHAMKHYSQGVLLIKKNLELEKANEELKTLDITKTKFMILINHELKTPLTVITSFSSLLNESNLNEEQKVYLNRIILSSNRLNEVIDDTLLLTKHQANTLKLTLKKTSIVFLVQSIIEELKSELSKKDLRVILEISSDPIAPFFMDSELMKRALLHLISNAIRFSEIKSEITIRLSCELSYIRFVIENFGPHVHKEYIDEIQKPFKLQQEIMNHSKGLGLGLSVAESILSRHNSKLIVENLKDSAESTFVRVSFLLKS